MVETPPIHTRTHSSPTPNPLPPPRRLRGPAAVGPPHPARHGGGAAEGPTEGHHRRLPVGVVGGCAGWVGHALQNVPCLSPYGIPHLPPHPHTLASGPHSLLLHLPPLTTPHHPSSPLITPPLTLPPGSTQTSLREGCNAILRSDCRHLLARLLDGSRRALPSVLLQLPRPGGGEAGAEGAEWFRCVRGCVGAGAGAGACAGVRVRGCGCVR